jgi:hypothetical protein
LARCQRSSRYHGRMHLMKRRRSRSWER